MLNFLVLSNSETINKAVEMALEMTLTQNRITPKVYPILLRTDADGSEEKRLAEFNRVATQIEDYIIKQSDYVHDRFIGIIDCPNMTDVYDLHALTSIAGALIIAFPAIQWIPLYKDANLLITEEKETKGRMTLQKAIDLCRGGYSPLFDGDGLRGILLDRVRHIDKEKRLSPRVDLAFAIDEEPHYAFMNAYTAFRFGYRGIPVMSGRCAEILLRNIEEFPHAYIIKDEQKIQNNVDKVPDTEIKTIVAFEDLFLKFPDRTDYEEREFDFGNKRDETWNVLKQVTLRVITTSSTNDEKVANNKSMTLEQYFAQDQTRKCVSNWKTKNREKDFLNHLCRKIDNVLGGKWLGYWGIGVLWWGGLWGALLWSLCYNQLLFVCLLLLNYGYSIWKNRNKDKIIKEMKHRHSRLPLRIKRWQWAFMPMYYENHNPLWLDKLPKNGITFWEIAHKPMAGIFGLRNKCGLPNASKFKGIYNLSMIRELYNNAIYKNIFTLDAKASNVNGHGSPGMAQEIAMWLIRRAERMKDDIIDVEGAVHAAVLSDIACELLDCKTPTMAIEALKWKHYFEVLAECEFVGVTDEIDVRDRYIDIHNALGRICRSENGFVREKVFNSGMAVIMDSLAGLLRGKGKMEEAAFFTKNSRHHHRRLMAPFMRSLLAYPEWVLFSKLNFAISLSGLFIMCCVYLGSKMNLPCMEVIKDTCKVLCLGSDILGNNSSLKNDIVLFIAHQMAYLHLGFIAAHFLLFVNRR